MCLKGFLQKRQGEENAPLIRMLDKKKQGRGFFGIRLKTEVELEAEAAQASDKKA
jgi:hypothetical protein